MNRALPALLLIALAGGASAAPEPAGAPTDSTLTRETLTLKSAHGVTIEAEAGRLLVSENRANPTSRRIPIGYLRLRSHAQSPRAPLFYLAARASAR